MGGALGSIIGYEVVAHAHGERSPITGPMFSHLRLGPSEHGVVLAMVRPVAQRAGRPAGTPGD